MADSLAASAAAASASAHTDPGTGGDGPSAVSLLPEDVSEAINLLLHTPPEKEDEEDSADSVADSSSHASIRVERPIPGKRYHVFFSQAGNDKALALEVYKTMTMDGGLRVVFDNEGGFLGGTLTIDMIRTFIRASDVFVVLVSPEMMASLWTCKEVAIAFEEGKTIIPLFHSPAFDPSVLNNPTISDRVEMLLQHVDGVFASPMTGRSGRRWRRAGETREARATLVLQLATLVGEVSRPAFESVTRFAERVATHICDEKGAIDLESPIEFGKLVPGPAPGAYVVPSEDLVDAVEKGLLAAGETLKSEGDTRVPVTVVYGMGGMGKAALCRYVAHLPSIAKAFRRVIWVALAEDRENRGQRKQLNDRILHTLHHGLGMDKRTAGGTEMENTKNAMQAALEAVGGPVLFVLNGVGLGQFKPFADMIANKAAILAATRELSHIFNHIPGNPPGLKLDPLEPAVATQVFLNYVEQVWSDLQNPVPTEADGRIGDLVAIARGHPFQLEILASLVVNEKNLQDLVEDRRVRANKLKTASESMSASKEDPEIKAYASTYGVIELTSLHFDKLTQMLFHLLGAFPANTAIPIPAIVNILLMTPEGVKQGANLINNEIEHLANRRLVDIVGTTSNGLMISTYVHEYLRGLLELHPVVNDVVIMALPIAQIIYRGRRYRDDGHECGQERWWHQGDTLQAALLLNLEPEPGIDEISQDNDGSAGPSSQDQQGSGRSGRVVGKKVLAAGATVGSAIGKAGAHVFRKRKRIRKRKLAVVRAAARTVSVHDVRTTPAAKVADEAVNLMGSVCANGAVLSYNTTFCLRPAFTDAVLRRQPSLLQKAETIMLATSNRLDLTGETEFVGKDDANAHLFQIVTAHPEATDLLVNANVMGHLDPLAVAEVFSWRNHLHTIRIRGQPVLWASLQPAVVSARAHVLGKVTFGPTTITLEEDDKFWLHNPAMIKYLDQDADWNLQLDLQEVFVHPTWWEAVIKVRGHLITSVSAINNQTFDDTAIALLLSNCTSLFHLDVGNTLVTDVGLRMAADWLGTILRRRDSAPLTYLSLHGCSVSDDGVAPLVEHMPNLTKINLYATDISDLSLQAISTGCENLEELNVQQCPGITRKGTDRFHPSVIQFDPHSAPRRKKPVRAAQNVHLMARTVRQGTTKVIGQAAGGAAGGLVKGVRSLRRKTKSRVRRRK